MSSAVPQPRKRSSTFIDKSHVAGPGSGPMRCRRTHIMSTAVARPPMNARPAARRDARASKAASRLPSTTIAGAARVPIQIITPVVPVPGSASALTATTATTAAKAPA